MSPKLLGVLIAVDVVVCGAAFYGGMQYAKAHAPLPGQRFAGGQGAFVQRGVTGRNGAGGPMGAGGMGFIAGEVLSKDATSFTLKLRDGGSKVILYSTSTRIGKMTDGSIDDVASGTEVTVTGPANQDGSVTASQVQIRPAGQMGQMPPRDAAGR